MRIVIENSEYIAVGFRVPVARDAHARSRWLATRSIPRPAIDVLSPEFDAGRSARRVAGARQRGDRRCAAASGSDRRRGQRLQVGDLLCHRRSIRFARWPRSRCEQIQALIAASQKLVRANVLEDSGDTIVTYGGRKRRTTHESDPGASLWVYGRKGEPCRRCGEPIRGRMQGPDARVTFWCPRCQPMPDGSDVDGLV